MAQLFSRFESGLQITAGAMVGSVLGASGLNAYADRLNSITTADNLVTGSVVSGTSTEYYGTGTLSGTSANMFGSVINALNVSGTNLIIFSSGTTKDLNYGADTVGDVACYEYAGNWQDINGLTKTITTNGGAVFAIMHTEGANTNTAGGIKIRIARSGTTAGTANSSENEATQHSTADERMSMSISWIDTPAAGTSVYTGQLTRVTTGSAVTRESVLNLIELKA